MNRRILFIDESGKTGTQRYSGIWNFESQPYFALCGVLVDETNLDTLNNFIEGLRKKYKIQGEIKATKRLVQKNSENIILELWKEQNKINSELFIEIVNKKYCIAMIVVDYCIFPYYDSYPEDYKSKEAVFLRKCFANYIYESISDQLLGQFVEFFDNNTQDIQQLIQLCYKLIKEIKNDAVKKDIQETIDSINNKDKLKLMKHNLFPLVDYYKGECSTVAVCPHVNCFDNILNRINNLNNLNVIHDKINYLEEALKKDAEERGIDKIQFENSKRFNILQIADFWCGNINTVVQNKLLGINDKNNIIEEIVQRNVNFVGTFKEQELLFNNNMELKIQSFLYRDCFKE